MAQCLRWWILKLLIIQASMTVLCVWAMPIAVWFVDETFLSLRIVGDMLEKSISALTKKIVHIAELLLLKEI